MANCLVHLLVPFFFGSAALMILFTTLLIVAANFYFNFIFKKTFVLKENIFFLLVPFGKVVDNLISICFL